VAQTPSDADQDQDAEDDAERLVQVDHAGARRRPAWRDLVEKKAEGDLGEKEDANSPVQPDGDPVVAGSDWCRCRTTYRTGVGVAAIEPRRACRHRCHPSSAPRQSPVR
jgi:hypothetical protein